MQVLKIVWSYYVGVKSQYFEKKLNFESPHDLFSQARLHTLKFAVKFFTMMPCIGQNVKP